MVDALTPTGGAQKIPRAPSVKVKVILSSVRSDTARPSRWLSFSSSLSRLI